MGNCGMGILPVSFPDRLSQPGRRNRPKIRASRSYHAPYATWYASTELIIVVPDSRFPIPDSRFPIPDSLFPF
ncbi:MAG: hypothetical protein F6K65_30430 [Moorea sp. SIO3C2]|nr:hypothetical protein [Moorena sp. SIO3C2]